MIIKNLLERIKNSFIKTKVCEHLYFPYYDYSIDKTYPIGQQCCLCKKFNSNESLGIDFHKVPDWRTNGKTYINR